MMKRFAMVCAALLSLSATAAPEILGRSGLTRDAVEPANRVPGLAGEVIEGAAEAVRGDTLSVAGREIRLAGVRAPEPHQQCLRDGARWPCGQRAIENLHALVAGQAVRCQFQREWFRSREEADCYVGTTLLNRAQVAAGMAMTREDGMRRFAREQLMARRGHKGLWASQFLEPEQVADGLRMTQWRAGCEETRGLIASCAKLSCEDAQRYLACGYMDLDPDLDGVACEAKCAPLGH